MFETTFSMYEVTIDQIYFHSCSTVIRQYFRWLGTAGLGHGVCRNIQVVSVMPDDSMGLVLSQPHFVSSVTMQAEVELWLGLAWLGLVVVRAELCSLLRSQKHVQ